LLSAISDNHPRMLALSWHNCKSPSQQYRCRSDTLAHTRARGPARGLTISNQRDSVRHPSCLPNNVASGRAGTLPNIPDSRGQRNSQPRQSTAKSKKSQGQGSHCQDTAAAKTQPRSCRDDYCRGHVLPGIVATAVAGQISQDSSPFCMAEA